MHRLTTHADTEDALRRISERLASHALWFCAEGRGVGVGAPTELRRGDWELRAAGPALLLAYAGARGPRVWRVTGWEERGEGLLLAAARRLGAERATLELWPRASAAAGAAALTAARTAECERLAATVCETWPGARVEQARLSAGARRGEPGRYARIVLARGRERRAVTGPVVALAPSEADAFVASALVWFMRAGARKGRREPTRRLALVAPRELSAAAAERVALLRAGVREAVEVFADTRVEKAAGACEAVLESVRVPELSELLGAASRPARPRAEELSETARAIVSLAPEAIDVVRARRGETLRFRGLAFARVRRVAGRELAWFGVEGARARRVLDASSRQEFLELVAELREHRRADADARAHALFRAAPEAWLESLLRRDVSKLDPGLRLAPVHAQFSPSRTAVRGAAARPIDLLALRRDGRLAVIELKVSESAALPLQAADYWRRVAAHHRAGHIRTSRFFGDAEVSTDPPLVYVVAPLLRFHRSFQALARCLTPEIEIYSFDLNEDWRAGVRVARRCHVNQ